MLRLHRALREGFGGNGDGPELVTGWNTTSYTVSISKVSQAVGAGRIKLSRDICLKLGLLGSEA